MRKLTFKQKQVHYEKVRRSNYLASLRLEGFDTSPADLDKPLPTREEVLKSIELMILHNLSPAFPQARRVIRTA